jgi:hypothetical protein
VLGLPEADLDLVGGLRHRGVHPGVERLVLHPDVELVDACGDAAVVDGGHRLGLRLRGRPAGRRERLHDVTGAGLDVVLGVRLRGVEVLQGADRVDDEGAVDERADEVVEDVELALLHVPRRVGVPGDVRGLGRLRGVLDLLLDAQQRRRQSTCGGLDLEQRLDDLDLDGVRVRVRAGARPTAHGDQCGQLGLHLVGVGAGLVGDGDPARDDGVQVVGVGGGDHVERVPLRTGAVARVGHGQRSLGVPR